MPVALLPTEQERFPISRNAVVAGMHHVGSMEYLHADRCTLSFESLLNQAILIQEQRLLQQPPLPLGFPTPPVVRCFIPKFANRMEIVSNIGCEQFIFIQ